VWRYASQADREKNREALMADPAFKEYLILKSTSFSPL